MLYVLLRIVLGFVMFYVILKMTIGGEMLNGFFGTNDKTHKVRRIVIGSEILSMEETK